MHSPASPDVVGGPDVVGPDVVGTATLIPMSGANSAGALFAGEMRCDQGTTDCHGVHLILAALVLFLQFRDAGRAGGRSRGKGLLHQAVCPGNGNGIAGRR